MARKLCSICQTRSIGTGPGTDADQARLMGYCNTCLTEAEWENMHSDYGHDIDGPDSDDDGMGVNHRVLTCWVCHPELNPNNAKIEVKAGHTNTVAKTNTSHADHNHPRTPAARAACRKSMATTGHPYDIRKEK